MSRETNFHKLYIESDGIKLTFQACEVMIESSIGADYDDMYFLFESYPVCRVLMPENKPVLHSIQKAINRLKISGRDFDRCIIITSIKNYSQVMREIETGRRFIK